MAKDQINVHNIVSRLLQVPSPHIIATVGTHTVSVMRTNELGSVATCMKERIWIYIFIHILDTYEKSYFTVKSERDQSLFILTRQHSKCGMKLSERQSMQLHMSVGNKNCGHENFVSEYTEADLLAC